jgi:Mg-chelatase subunit ChlD
LRKSFRRRTTLATLSGILLLLAGAFVWYLLYTAPAAPLLTVAVTDYAAPLPPNAFAQEDVDRFPSTEERARFLSVGRGNIRSTRLDATRWEGGDAALRQIAEWVEGAKPGGPQKNVELLYLSAHGVVDEEGHPCLILPGGEQPFDRTRWLRLDRLIDALDEARPTVKKLLMLDANRMAANWNIGLLYNGFADALAKSTEKAKSVAILSSAGTGEAAYAAAELQGTPFGYFVARALAGDRAADADHDDEISVKELHRFVQRNVAQWVARNRSDVQTPLLLLPGEQDFRLVFVVSEASSKLAPAQPPTTYFASVRSLWEKVGDLWGRHERLLAAKQTMPVWYDRCHEWHQFQQGLVRCEQLVLAGGAYGVSAANAIDQMQELADELERDQQIELPIHNLAAARRQHAWPPRPEALKAAVASRLDGSDDPPKPLPPEVTNDYFVRADAAWQWLVAGGEDARRQPLDREKVRAILDFVGRPTDQAELAELHLLRLLAGEEALAGTGAADPLWSESRLGLIQALRLREVAEQTISLADPRCHYAIRAAGADADRLLRDGEDRLFVGPRDPAEVASEKTEGAYRAVATTAQRLAAIYATRDRAWSQLPYLAQWFCRPPQPDGNQDLGGIQEAAQVLEQTAELDDQLAQFVAEQLQPKQERAGRSLDLETLAATADRVEAGLTRLTSDFEQFADRVRQQQTWDERSPRDIALLLNTPLVSGSSRRELGDRYLSEMSRRDATWDVPAETKTQPTPQPSTPEPGESPPLAGSNAHLARLAAGEHPALVLAGEKTAAEDAPRGGERADDWLRLAQQGNKLRELLSEWAESGASGARQKHDDAADRRTGLSDRERRWRRIAPVCTIPLLRDKDPVRRLAQFDGNELLVWQTRRRLDDFWGNGDGDSNSTPYFAAAFEDARSAARKRTADPADGERWRELAVVCNEFSEAAKTPVVGQAGSDQPRLSHGSLFKPLRLSLPEHMPIGTAALSVSDAAGRPAEIGDKAAGSEKLAARMPIAVRGGTERTSDRTLLVRQITQPNGPPANTADAARWTLAWLYRGHYHPDPFPVAPEGPSLQVVYQRQPPRPTFVTVRGEESKQASVVFILDCSFSMRETVQTERGKKPRMELAREALIRIVDLLGKSQKYRVGLWLYGHRAAITEKGGRKWNDAWGADNNVAPGQDVAQVMPLGLLDGTMRAEILALLADDRRVRPWGVTPLYLSMVEALRGYQRSPVRGPRRLVVITDGLDEVPPNGPKPALPDDVTRAVREDRQQNATAPVRIQVLHCGSGGDEALRTLVESKLQGDYISVSNWAQLEQKLEEAVGLAEYEVGRVDSTAPRRTEHLGESFVVQDVPPGRKGRYEVRLAQRAPPVRSLVDLEGEESLALSLMRDPGGDRLVHERYDRDGRAPPAPAVRKNVPNPAPIDLDPDFNPGEFYVAAHRPEPREGGGWVFPISIQNGDASRFSPRPTEAWVEITPVLADGSKLPAYPFYDLAFEPERPVPVLRADAPTWPARAQQAEIRLWFKVGRSGGEEKSREVSIAEVDADAVARDLHVPGAPDARFSVTTEEIPAGQVKGWPAWPGGCRLVVEEEYPPLTAKADWSRVQTLERPDRVERTFNYDGRWARHEFYFADKGRLDVRRDKLVVTAQGSRQKGAVTVDEPLHITVRD